MEREPTLLAGRRRAMMQSYEQQLMAARRLAHFRVRMRSRAGLDPTEPDPGAKRHTYVHQVANELYNSLVFTGLAPQDMEEIRSRLCQEFKVEFEFVYPPDANLCIFIRDGDRMRPLSTLEEQAVTAALARITKEKVDKDMHHASRRTGLQA